MPVPLRPADKNVCPTEAKTRGPVVDQFEITGSVASGAIRIVVRAFSLHLVGVKAESPHHNSN
jgi:hypothetical protein